MNTLRYYEFQIVAITINTLVGVQSLYLPAVVTRVAGTAAWLSVLLSGIVSTVVLVLISRTASSLSGQSYISFAQEKLGAFAAIPVLALVGSELLILSMEVRIFGEIVSATLLPTTPLDVVIIAMILLLAYFSGHGPKTFARVNELLLIPMLVLTIGIELLLSSHATLSRLKPFLGYGPGAALAGAAQAASAFAGTGIALYFMSFSNQPDRMPATALVVGVLTAAVYAGFTMTCLISIGPSLTIQSSWPTLVSTTLIRLPAVFLEKVDSAFTAGWLFAVFTTAGNIMYVITRSLGELGGLRDSRILVVALIPWTFLLAALPRNAEAGISIITLATLAELALAVLLSLYLLSQRKTTKGGAKPERKTQKMSAS